MNLKIHGLRKLLERAINQEYLLKKLNTVLLILKI